jgi:SAM-dependent methyltransferase
MHPEAITPRLDIPSGALVLEVGSGHRPHPRADVLTDKYLGDMERGGRLVTDRPFVQADAQQLPFKPKVFDYVLCRHVLEHLGDPEAFFHEISRVGEAGYIETPSVIWEYLHPTRTYHRWHVSTMDRPGVPCAVGAPSLCCPNELCRA